MGTIHDVKRLHEKFGFPRKDKPGFLDDKFMQMRLDFAFEELLELGQACGFDFDLGSGNFKKSHLLKPNLENALDALVDKVYVDFGTADLMGFTNTAPPEVQSNLFTIWWHAWNRVHKANMSKVKGMTSRGHEIDLVKPKGWVKPTFGDLLP